MVSCPPTNQPIAGGDVPAVDLDAGGRQEEHAGRDPLDGPVEAEDQPGGEVHHAAGVGLVHIGEIHNDGDAVAEGLADDAGLVVGGGVDRDDAAQVGHGNRGRGVGLLIGVVVVELLALAVGEFLGVCLVRGVVVGVLVAVVPGGLGVAEESI